MQAARPRSGGATDGVGVSLDGRSRLVNAASMGFLLVFSLVVGLVHAYLWRRLVRDTRLRLAAARTATVALCLLWVSIPLTVLAFRDPLAGVRWFSFAGSTWLGLTFYLLVLLLAWDVVRLSLWLSERVQRWGASAEARRVSAEAQQAPPAPDPAQDAGDRETRRRFVARAAAAGALVTTAGIGVVGVRSALWDITRPEVSVVLPRFPHALDGYTIALMSDIHIGPTLDGRFLRHLVEQTNAMKPDMVAITGDLVDGSVAHIGSQVAELGGLQAAQGVFFVTGNHEYYSGAVDWVAFLRSLGIRVLMNERVELGDRARGGASFDLAGVPDHRAGFHGHLAPDALAATKGRDPERELVMLAHQPVQVADVVKTGAGLQLSGHTHGGQLYPFGALTMLVQPYLAGLSRHASSDTLVYVSRGTGFWGPPMRVLAPAEIARIRLTGA